MRSLRHRVAAVLSTALVAVRLLAPEAFSPCLSWHGSDPMVVAAGAFDAQAGHGASHGHPASGGHDAPDAHHVHEMPAAHGAHNAPADAPACPHCESGDCCCVAPALSERASNAVPSATVDLSRAPVGVAPDVTPRSRVAFLLPFATAPPTLG